MKKKINKWILKPSAIILMALLIGGCDGFFEDPLKDKDSGEDVNLLIIDLNFFTTRVSYKFVDATNGFLITSPATITFSGKNANDIVNFGGKKNLSYTTEVGQLELTIDPNVKFSETNPFEFAINVTIEGYRPMSKGVQFTNEGIKTVEVQLSKISDQNENILGGEIHTGNGDTTFVFKATSPGGNKSAQIESNPYNINYTITLSSILKFKNQQGNLIFSSSQQAMEAYNANPANFINMTINSFSDYNPWIDVLDIGGSTQCVIFHLLETGNLEVIRVNGIVIGDLNGGTIASSASFTGTPTPDYFGFAELSGSSYRISGTDTIYSVPGFSYKLVEASDEILCPTGTSLTFQSPIVSSFSITADVYDRQEIPQLLMTLNFTGNFPETFVVENTPPVPVTLVFRNNNPSFKPIPNLQIDNFCTGNANITVEPQTGYEGYQIVLKAFCPDNPTIAIAPTYSGEFRIANSSDPWQGASMVGGVVNLLGKPNQEYEYRLLWENKWEFMTIWTEFDAQGHYLHTFDSRSIVSQILDDGRIRISIDQDFKQSVCNKMGW
jgi:hypothetical protein